MNAGTLYGKYLNAEPQELVQQGAILQDLVRRYPWFSLGRLLLFKSLCGLGGEASLSESEKTAAYVYSRSKLYFIRQESLQMEEQQAEIDFFTLDLTQEIEKEEPSPKPATQKRREGKTTEFILEPPRDRTCYPGADYFGKTDMAGLELDVTEPIDLFITEQPRFTEMLSRAGEHVDTQEQDASPVLSGDDFITETLARIYAEQGYHKLAIACYGKLILLYPEKSVYFASLVQEIKQKTNN